MYQIKTPKLTQITLIIPRELLRFRRDDLKTRWIHEKVITFGYFWLSIRHLFAISENNYTRTTRIYTKGEWQNKKKIIPNLYGNFEI